MRNSMTRTRAGGYQRIKTGIKSIVDKICEKLEYSILNSPEYKENFVFGPVPSRRLGNSLGINNIKRKICTYNCIYCQAGQTSCCSTERDCCLNPYVLHIFAKKKIHELVKEKFRIDYISFVPNGEPTLDNNLSKEITLLREFGYKIAVFTNGSLLWNNNVRENLMFADYVSIKIDTVQEATWETINRPHPRLRFDCILRGISEFAESYKGILITETMLVNNINDNIGEIEQIGEFLKTLKRNKSYFSIPIRPPAKDYATAPTKEVLEDLSAYIKSNIENSEMLCCPENGDFKAIGIFEEDFLGIVSVHPMREESVRDLLKQNNKEWSTIQNYIDQEIIKEIKYLNQNFYASCND